MLPGAGVQPNSVWSAVGVPRVSDIYSRLRYETQPKNPDRKCRSSYWRKRQVAQSLAQTPAPAASPKTEGLTSEVATLIRNTIYDDIPEDVIEVGKKSILDGLGLALCGSVAETGSSEGFSLC